MITDPTATNLFFVNLEGVGLIQIDDEAPILEVHVALVRDVVGCDLRRGGGRKGGTR